MNTACNHSTPRPSPGSTSSVTAINIIDVGAGRALPAPWKQQAHSISNWLRIHTREPDSTPEGGNTCDTLLWSRNEERNFFIYRGTAAFGGSLLLYNYDYVIQHYATLKSLGAKPLADSWFERALPTEVVRRNCRKLDDVLRQPEFKGPWQFLTIDARGAELQVLQGAEDYLRHAGLGVQVTLYEFPLYREMHLMEEVVDWLAARCFTLVQLGPRTGSFNSQRQGLFLKSTDHSPAMHLICQVYGLPAPRTAPPAQAPRPLVVTSLHQALVQTDNLLKRFHNIHRNRRCVIIGNGPSLNKMDLRFLAREYTFGMNRIFLGFEQWQFQPTYYVAVNTLVLEQNVEIIQGLGMPKFIRSTVGMNYLYDFNNTVLLRLHGHKYFSKDLLQGYHEGYTVTYVAMQIAYWMGFDEVILIGVDHNFATKGPANQEVLSDSADPNHFHPDYFGPGMKWHLPDLEQSEISYRMAKTAFEEEGRRLLDATVGGKLDIFPKVDYRKLFYSGEKETGQRSAEALNQEGETLFQKGRLKEALACFEQALTLEPPSVAVCNNLGVAWYMQGDATKAQHFLRLALALDPQNAEIQRNLRQCV